MGATNVQYQATRNARTHAKESRTGMTDAERRLWSRLRLQQLGVRFRRQHPLGPYILDFACLAPKLAIEVDGSQHLQQRGYDAVRTAWLAGHGFVELRYWANDVMSQTDAIVEQIHQRLKTLGGGAAPTPALPQRGREQATNAEE